MTVDSLGMIRRGWQDAVATVAPQVPGLPDLLEKRLGEAIRVGDLDETSLLAIVDAATQLAANTGAVDVVAALSKRLRRHVYEYLLSLDAAATEERGMTTPALPHAPEGGGLLIGADEVAALRRRSSPHGEPISPSSHPPANGSPIPLPATAASSRPPSPGASQDPSAVAGVAPVSAPPTRSVHPPAASAPPRFSFHIGDPDDVRSTPIPSGNGFDGDAGRPLPELFAPADLEPPVQAEAPAAHRASFSDPSTWPRPVTPTLRGGRAHPFEAADPAGPLSTLEEATPEDWQPPQDPLPARPQFDELAWPPAPAGAHEVEAVGADGAVSGSPATWLARDLGTMSAPGGVADERATPAEDPVRPPRGWPGRLLPDPEPELPEGAAWQLQATESVELHLAPHFQGEPEWREPADQTGERDITSLRSGVEEKLRRKRCDDAAAILQQAAQELGGQSVAELALDAGDRCRTLGKRNAALNCYLAASRADPVYEAPLARLADICIDDQDIDLAVSYLERIARLTRLRGDQRGAMRIYRKIATIAPYRDDVLEMLMRAQTGGRMDG